MLKAFIRRHPTLLAIARRVRRVVGYFARPYQSLFTLYYRLRLRRCGKNVDFSTTMIIRNPRNIEIGDNCSFSNFVILDGHDRITIGSNCMFANRAVIATATHDETAEPMNSVMRTSPVTIGSNVWLGVGATVLPGLTIGDGAIIGAHALATKDVPANAVIIGVPGRVVRFRKLSEPATDVEPLAGGGPL